VFVNRPLTHAELTINRPHILPDKLMSPNVY
jgi:hypothetical protein